MIPKFKAIILSTVPNKKESGIDSPFMANTPSMGKRWSRSKFIALHLSILFGVMLFTMLSSLFGGDWISKYGFLGGISYIFFLVAILAIILVPCLILVFYGTACRLRDIGSDPFLAFIFFIPVIGWLQTLYLMFCPGQKGTNKYGKDPRVKSTLAKNQTVNVNSYKQTPQNNQQQEYAKLGINKDDMKSKTLNTQDIFKIKKILRKQEILKIKNTFDTSQKIVCVGYDSVNTKYYLSVSNLDTPKHEFKRQYFLNYQLMCSSLFEQTGLLINELANEIS